MSHPTIMVLGGSFDPFHLGHLEILRTVQHHFPTTSEIQLLPSFSSVEKKESGAAAKHRLAMLELIIATYFAKTSPIVTINTTELNSGRPQFSVDTIQTLSTTTGAKYSFVIGADQFSQFHRWKTPDKLLDALDRLVVINRGEGTPTVPLNPLFSPYLDKLCFIEMPPQEMASSTIRERFARGQDIQDWVPDLVYRYILSHHLYL